MAKEKNQRTDRENKRKERLRRLKVEGHKEAAILYEKYLRGKLDELKFIKELIEKEQLEI